MKTWESPIEIHIYLSYDETVSDLANRGLRSDILEPEYERIIGKFILKVGKKTRWYHYPSVKGLKISKKGFESLLENGFYALGYDASEDICQGFHISIYNYPKRYRKYTKEII